MSLSIREQALQAIVAALGADGSPASKVTRSRLGQIEQGELPCYDVTPGDEKVEDGGDYGDHDSVTRTLPVMVRAMVDAAVQEGEDASVDAVSPAPVDDSSLDPFYVFAVQQLCGNGADLGGLVIDVVEMGGPVVFQPGGRDIIGLEQQFEVKFATKRGDPTQTGL